jgi:magnesium chelatase subunit I
VQSDDLMDMAPAALRHRLRRDPMDETGSSARIERAMRQQEAALA